MFARAVNEDATIKAAMKDFILYKIDCEKGEGIALAKKYEVRGYPTFVAINSKGEVTDSWVGYGGPEQWSQTALMAAADPRTIPEKKKAYDAAPTAGLAVCLANNASTSYDFAGAVEYYRKARELNPEGLAEYTEQILTFMYYGARGGAFTFDDVEKEAKLSLAETNPTPEQQVELALMLRNMARQTGEPERAVPYITSALKATEGNTDEGVLKSRTQLEIDYALLVEKDKDKALELFRSTFSEGWMENANKLNNFAWWCFENDVNLEEAGELALKGAELADSDSGRANILDTAAEICNKLGNCDEAVAHMQRAIELDPEKQYFKDQLAKFQKVLEEKQNG